MKLEIDLKTAIALKSLLEEHLTHYAFFEFREPTKEENDILSFFNYLNGKIEGVDK